MSRVYLSLGSNLGGREENILKAVSILAKRVGCVLRISHFFYSKAQGYESNHDFCNVCLCVETSYSPLLLLSILKDIEKEMGRIPKTSAVYEDRVIDIDIILYDDIHFHSPKLTIPHPKYKERDFVLIPLQEVYQG